MAEEWLKRLKHLSCIVFTSTSVNSLMGMDGGPLLAGVVIGMGLQVVAVFNQRLVVRATVHSPLINLTRLLLLV